MKFLFGKVVSKGCTNCNHSLAKGSTLVEGFDDCLEKSVATKNAARFRKLFKKIHDIDLATAAQLTDPTILKAFSVTTEKYLKFAMDQSEKIENGSFDWVDFNNERKNFDEELYNKVN